MNTKFIIGPTGLVVPKQNTAVLKDGWRECTLEENAVQIRALAKQRDKEAGVEPAPAAPVVEAPVSKPVAPKFKGAE